MARIFEVRSMPLVTVVRLMGAIRRRLDPKSVPPGMDASPADDAATIAALERRMAEQQAGKP